MLGRNPLVAKLSSFAPFSDQERDVLEDLCAREERIDVGVNLMVEGKPPRAPFVVTRGLACRYRLMADGRRQILTFLIPGDFFGLHVFMLSVADHSIITMTPTRLATIQRGTVFEIVEHHPRIAAALWWSVMQEAAMLRERIVTLGRRNARARVAYLLCELFWRHRAIGLSDDHALRLPLTQAEIADALGLTAIHVNRVLQYLRGEGMITLAHRQLTLHQVGRLQSLAELDPGYLHLTGMPGSRDYLERLTSRKPADRPRDS